MSEYLKKLTCFVSPYLNIAHTMFFEFSSFDFWSLFFSLPLSFWQDQDVSFAILEFNHEEGPKLSITQHFWGDHDDFFHHVTHSLDFFTSISTTHPLFIHSFVYVCPLQKKLHGQSCSFCNFSRWSFTIFFVSLSRARTKKLTVHWMSIKMHWKWTTKILHNWDLHP